MKEAVRNIRVVKLGGSLLKHGDIGDRVTTWLETQPARKTALIVGGGDLIDVMRRWSAQFELDPVAMHWRCVELLTYTWQIATELLPQCKPIADEAALQSWRDDDEDASIALVAAHCFYQADDDSSCALPASWATTTDSIAALLAHRLDANELVLLKSCSLPAGMNWQQASQQGIVDEAFFEIIEGIANVAIVNLNQLAESER